MAVSHCTRCHSHHHTSQYPAYEAGPSIERFYNHPHPHTHRTLGGDGPHVMSGTPAASVPHPYQRSASGQQEQAPFHTMHPYYYGHQSSGRLSHPNFHDHVYPPDNGQHPVNIMTHDGPWQVVEIARSSATPTAPYLPLAASHGLHNPNVAYSPVASPSTAFNPSQFPGVLTPEQSPHTTTISVSEEQQYPSEPPREDSPPVREDLEQVNKALRSSSLVQRPDGVRKKNAKFEIPEGRTIETLDKLLRHERDESKVKELKTQKRLLKNREAALQSRSRKKAYTERLETENKRLLSAFKQQQQHAVTARQLVWAEDGRSNDMASYDPPHVNALKEELARMKHQNEQLLHDNSLMQDQLQNHFSGPTSSAFSSAENSGQESLTFDSDEFGFMDEDLGMTNLNGVKREPRADVSTLVEQLTLTAGSNALLTLLMYGAHVAASTSQHDVGTVEIPALSPEQCSASADLIHSVLNSNRPSGQFQRQPKVDLNNLTPADAQAINEFKTLCSDHSTNGTLLVSRALNRE